MQNCARVVGLERIVGGEMRWDIVEGMTVIGVQIIKRRMLAESSSSSDIRARNMMNQRQQIVDFGTKSPHRQRWWHDSFR